MSGICIAAGTRDAKLLVSRQVAQMSTNGQLSQIVEHSPDMASGRSTHACSNRRGVEHTVASCVFVILDGEIFDDRGLVEQPLQLIRRLYESDQLDKIAFQNGSFAGIIVDQKRNRVVLFSDRLGSRLLFVWAGPRGLAAATRLDSLLLDDRIPRKLSFAGLSDLLSFHRTLCDHTQYADVSVLPGAAIWTYENGRCTRRTSRKLAWSKTSESKLDLAERLAAALRNAARRRIPNSHPYGLLLSGGIDSRTVLAAMRSVGGSPTCLSLAVSENQEIRTARKVAAAAGCKYLLQVGDPEAMSASLKEVTAVTSGLFVQPINLYYAVREFSVEHTVLFSGHGLDYTLRGMYLPSARLEVGHRGMRLPRLRKLSNSSPETLAENMRFGIPSSMVERVLRREIVPKWRERRNQSIANVVGDVEVASPHDAFDAIILHAQGRHHAHSDFVAMDAIMPHRSLPFDPEVFDIYLSMPAAWRIEEWVARRAMKLLHSGISKIEDANTGFRADLPFRLQLLGMLARSARRKLVSGTRSRPAGKFVTERSWLDHGELARCIPALRERTERLPDDPAIMDTGLFDRDNLRVVIAEHMEHKRDYIKLLSLLTTLSVWFEMNPYVAAIDVG